MIHPLTIMRLSQVRDQAGALEVWREHWNELEDHSYVLSEPNSGNAMRLPARMDFSPGGHLRSAFAYDNLCFLSHEVISTMVVEGAVHLPIDYTVAFDSNVASYLRLWMKGRTVPVVSMLQSVLKRLNQGRFNWDLMPFLLERSNSMLAGQDLTEIYETVLASEWFAASDFIEFMKSGVIRLTVSQVELAERAQRSLAEWDRLLRSGVMGMIDHRYSLFHASVAKMVLLQLDSPSPKSAASKLERFLAFMDTELRCMTMLCSRAALEFFASGGRFAPMGKVSNCASDLRRRVRNVAWDFLQRQWRQEFAGNHGRNRCFHVPYFLTFDSGLAELLDLFPQRGCLFGGTLRFPIFFQEFDFAALVLGRFPELGRVIGETFSVQAHEERASRLEKQPPDMLGIVQKLERELTRFEHN